MSYHATLKCWIMVVVSLIFHRIVKAGSSQDRDRVVITYNSDTDPCFNISTHSKHETKEAADSLCARAFLALERFESNACNGWRHAECRLLNGFTHFQCSCTISYCSELGIKSDIVSSFRDCAWKMYAEEIFYLQAPVPSENFQREHQKIYDQALQRSLRQRQSSISSSECYSVKALVPKEVAQGPYKCEYCNKSFRWRKSLVAHRKVHKEDVRCTICNVKFSTKANRRTHNINTHPEIAKAEAAAKNARLMIERPFACGQCPARFKSKKILQEHVPFHRGETFCHPCKIAFKRKADLTMHTRREHP